MRKVLVPFQGTPDDKAALELARRMTAGSAEVTILHVIKPGRAEEERLGARQEFDQTFTEEGPYNRASVRMKLVSHDKPAVAAIEEAGKGYDSGDCRGRAPVGARAAPFRSGPRAHGRAVPDVPSAGSPLRRPRLPGPSCPQPSRSTVLKAAQTTRSS